ncbi:hypothetical protein TNCV_2669531 [Trichonephila clavipes]|nr:hypothetical protein TNCV_2669531 [Trichonephila clavipes]
MSFPDESIRNVGERDSSKPFSPTSSEHSPQDEQSISDSPFLPTETGRIDNVEMRSSRAGASQTNKIQIRNRKINQSKTRPNLRRDLLDYGVEIEYLNYREKGSGS